MPRNETAMAQPFQRCWWNLFLDKTMDAEVEPAIRLLGHPAWPPERRQAVCLLEPGKNGHQQVVRQWTFPHSQEAPALDRLRKGNYWVSKPTRMPLPAVTTSPEIWVARLSSIPPAKSKEGWSPLGQLAPPGSVTFFADGNLTGNDRTIRVIGPTFKDQAPFVCGTFKGRKGQLWNEPVNRQGDVVACLNRRSASFRLGQMLSAVVPEHGWGAWEVKVKRNRVMEYLEYLIRANVFKHFRNETPRVKAPPSSATVATKPAVNGSPAELLSTPRQANPCWSLFCDEATDQRFTHFRMLASPWFPDSWRTKYDRTTPVWLLDATGSRSLILNRDFTFQELARGGVWISKPVLGRVPGFETQMPFEQLQARLSKTRPAGEDKNSWCRLPPATVPRKNMFFYDSNMTGDDNVIRVLPYEKIENGEPTRAYFLVRNDDRQTLLRRQYEVIQNQPLGVELLNGRLSGLQLGQVRAVGLGGHNYQAYTLLPVPPNSRRRSFQS